MYQTWHFSNIRTLRSAPDVVIRNHYCLSHSAQMDQSARHPHILHKHGILKNPSRKLDRSWSHIAPYTWFCRKGRPGSRSPASQGRRPHTDDTHCWVPAPDISAARTRSPAYSLSGYRGSGEAYSQLLKTFQTNDQISLYIKESRKTCVLHHL